MFRDRSWGRRAGVALLVLASLGGSTIALPHDAAGDADCNAIAVTHDGSAHSIAAAPDRGPLDGDHCFLCHSLRTFYPAFDRFEHHHYAPRAERLHVAPLDRAVIVAWTLVPGRAPPV
jgi:hypothetical protein